MKPRPWTSAELAYLTAHAHEGAEALAEALGRTVAAVKVEASRWGVSLRRSWLCPRCGMRVHAELSPVTGWCRACTVQESRDEAALRDRRLRKELAAERERVKAAERERQGIYSASGRARRSADS